MPKCSGELAEFGEERAVEVGDVLFRAGDDSYDFFVMLEGEVEIVRPDPRATSLITTHGAGRFLGELNLLTGQRLFADRPACASPGGCSRSPPTSSAGS